MWNSVFLHFRDKNHLEHLRLINSINTLGLGWASNLEIFIFKYLQMIFMIKKIWETLMKRTFLLPLQILSLEHLVPEMAQ